MASLEDVVTPPYRSALRVIAVTATVIGAFFIAQDRAAAFVDERVRTKTLAADKVMEMQMQRLERLDAQMALMQAHMSDIKVDIAKVRTILEKK